MSNSSDTDISGKVFRSELLTLVTGLVWKNSVEATLAETDVDQRIVDQFMAAKKGLLTFESIFQFDFDVIMRLGLPEEDAEKIRDDKYACPESYRDMLTRFQVAKFLEVDPGTQRYLNYIEENTYYRMLYGLPSLADDDYVYVTDDSNIDPATPVHELELADCLYLEEGGYLTRWKEEYPDKKYLQYIGKKRIDPYQARYAGKFDILWLNEGDNDNIVNDFRDCYERCTTLTLRTYYRKDLTSTNELYEGVMAMCILFMSVNQMFAKFLQADIGRDFYDLESIKQVYAAYGVPFYPSIPVSYHKKIVKKMNTLLSYKGSTRVFFELFDIFDSKDINIYAYYLRKQHKMSNNRPVFHYKADGSLDNDSMYDIAFGQVALYNNPPLELADPTNHVNYSSRIADDPYWISDTQLMQKIYNAEFNYLETKYMGIQTTYDMMSIVYESSYFIKMLLDNRQSLSGTDIYYSATNQYHSIFNLIIYLCGLVCKKYGYEGLISEKLPIVAKHLGYDFKADITTVREYILKEKAISSDTELLAIIEKMNVNSLTSIMNAMTKISDVRSFLLERMWTTTSTDAYAAYSHIYQTLLTSDIIEDTYKLSDGSVAETFSELLHEIDSTLYTRLISSLGNEEEIAEELTTVYVLFEKSVTNLRYLHFSDGIDVSPLMEQLFLLLKFFKSGKAELTGYNVVYTISSPAYNYFRLMDYIDREENDTDIDLDYIGFLEDILSMTEETTRYLDHIARLKDDFMNVEDQFVLQSIIKFLTDELYLETHFIYDNGDYIHLVDTIRPLEHQDIVYSILTLSEKASLLYEEIEYMENHFTIPDDGMTFDTKIYHDTLESALSSIRTFMDSLEIMSQNIILDDESFLFNDTFIELGPTDIWMTEIHSITFTMERTYEFRESAIACIDSSLFADGYYPLSENKSVNTEMPFSDSCILIDEQRQ